MSDYKNDKENIKVAWEAAKAQEFEKFNKKDLVKNDMFSTNDNDSVKSSNSTGVIQGYILIGLVCVALGLLVWNIFKSPPKYAYKVINVQAQFNKNASTSSGSNASAINTTSVNLSDEELTILGNEGWELVGTFLELETTHPNYGNSEYVTGLQPNIRPQRAVMVFKKQL